MRQLLGILLVTFFAAACGGQAEEYSEWPVICEVTYQGEPCVFECADCIEGVDEGFGSCENALPTATDKCDYQRTHPN